MPWEGETSKYSLVVDICSVVRWLRAAVRPDEKSEEFLQVRDLNLFFSDVDP